MNTKKQLEEIHNEKNYGEGELDYALGKLAERNAFCPILNMFHVEQELYAGKEEG